MWNSIGWKSHLRTTHLHNEIVLGALSFRDYAARKIRQKDQLVLKFLSYPVPF